MDTSVKFFLLTIILLLIGIFGEKALSVKSDFPSEADSGLKFEHVHPTEMRIPLTLKGTVSLPGAINIVSEINGKVVEVIGHESYGQIISKGQQVAKIQPTDVILMLDREKSNNDALKYQMLGAKLERDLYYKQRKDTFVSNTQNETLFNYKYEELLAKLKASDSNVALAQSQTIKSNLFSPVNGRILKVFVNQGQYVRSGDPIYSLEPIDSLQIKVVLNRNDLDILGVNSESDDSPIKTTQITIQQKSLNCSLIYIDWGFNPSAKLVALIYNVNFAGAPTGILRAGEGVEVQFIGKKYQKIVAVNKEALNRGSRITIMAPDGKQFKTKLNYVGELDGLALLDGSIFTDNDIYIWGGVNLP